MNVSDDQQDDQLGEVVEFDGVSSGWTLGRVLVGLLVLASFGVWVYAYSGYADREAPDTLDDLSFAARAEPICAAARAAVDELPNALEAADPFERAEQIRAASQVYRDMVDELQTEVPTGDRDRGIVELWLDRWRIILDDRDNYAGRLEENQEAVFYLSADAGRRAERSLSYVADTNDMPSCGAPDDVG